MTGRRLPLFPFAVGLGIVAGCGRNSAPTAVPVSPRTSTAAPGDVARSVVGRDVTVTQRPAPASPPPATAEPRVTLTPGEATIGPGDPGLQMLVQGPGSRGGRRDETGRVAWTVEPSGIVSVEPGGYLRPLGPGVAVLSARIDDATATARVKVATKQAGTWDFGEDIVPILTRAGCNTGSCHGRADGQNGFHLSLYGYDPKADFLAVTRDGGGRRLSRVRPEDSLVLAKATGRIPHVGGPRLVDGSPGYVTLAGWVKDGAPEARGDGHGALRSVVVAPGDVRLDEPGTQQLRVVAHFADGHERDVTRLASYRVNDEGTLAVTPEGKATLLRRGEADLVVRYQSQVVSTRLATIVNPDLAFDFAALKRRNVVDTELFKRLESLKVPPSPTAGDAVFLRRVSLDLTGEQPQPEEVRKFLADTDPEKRDKLVDRLIGSREFVQFWKIKLGDLLQISSARFNNGASYYHTWVEEQLTRNAPWDATVRTLLTALGNPMTQGGGPVNYALDGPDAKTQAEQTAQRFMGLRLRCAQCHDHPFDVWTQDDYFGLAAFFAKVQRGANAAAMSGRVDVKIDPKGVVEHLRTKKPATPKLLGGKAVTVAESDDPRKALAAWLTDAANPFFARATANWAWAQLFGKGIADPPDDLSRSNPPVHPELLDALAKHFVEHKFDLRELIRLLATSEAYGLSSTTLPENARDTRLFSHQIPRPLTAHQMADALAQATDVPNQYPGQAGRNRTRRAIEIADPSTASTILDTFGRCPRTVGCASVSTPALSLRQSLLLLGGDVVESKVASLNGYLASLLELSPEVDEVVENLYLRTVCRPPTQEELSRWSAELKQASSRKDATEDLFWALLNSREFAFNH